MRALYVLVSCWLLACSQPVTALRPQALTSSVAPLYSFTVTSGYHARASLVLGPDSALYGTAEKGGLGCGVVYRWDGQYTIIHTFSALDSTGRNTDGCAPVASVSFHGGRLWVPTKAGGTGGNPIRPAPGALVSMLPDGYDVKLEHAFTAGVDGASPMGALVWLGEVAYGATHTGVYRWNGTVNYLHAFPALYGSPVLGSDGLLHGYSAYGGANNAGFMYSLQPVSGAFIDEYDFASFSFSGNRDNTPLMSPLLGSDGAIYFADEFGGANGTGSIVKIERTATVIHEGGPWIVTSTPATPRFSGDGLLPIGTLIESGGWLYGTSVYGGTNGTGSIFRIGKDGRGYQVLYSFSPPTARDAGCYPYTGLTVGVDGALYGVTGLCGTVGDGVIYRFTP